MLPIIIFIIGLIIGSFLNCVIYRMEIKDKSRKKVSFLQGRSFCPHCKKKIAWYDLIPIISFFILRGKCRNCKKEISFQYPLVELGAGLMFFLVFNFQSLILNVVFWWIISCFLIIIFVYDLKHYIIPDRIIYPAIVIALVFRIWDLISNRNGVSFSSGSLGFEVLINYILAGLAGFLFFLFIVIISKGKWMGVGDVKLAFLIGLLLGYPDFLVALFFSFLLGAIIGISLILAKEKSLKSEVPFGPFLVAGIFIALFWADKIIDYYFKLFIV